MHELGGMLQQERTACVMCTVDAAKQSKVLLTVLFEKKGQHLHCETYPPS